jgi:ADYC domain
MSTSADRRSVKPTLPRAAAVLLRLAAVTLTASCGEAYDELDTLRTQVAAERDCPSGQCSDPGNTNGIYVSEGAGYCIPGPNRGMYFCPQNFRTEAGGAYLTGQRLLSANVWPDPPVLRSLRAYATYRDVPVDVKSLYADPKSGDFVAHVVYGGEELLITGDQLLDLKLRFNSEEFVFNLRFSSRLNENKIWVYGIQYELPSVPLVWKPYCNDGSGKAAFLPGRTVHSISAKMDTDERSTTMACVSGAIGGCMGWGYRPWEADASNVDQANYLYGSCLQAKRAAYFTDLGDYKSYTIKGTLLSVQDIDGIMQASSMPGVEALWSPKGAICFTPSYRRGPGPGGTPLPTLPSPIPLPTCPASIHQAAQDGKLQQELTLSAPLATGPASP